MLYCILLNTGTHHPYLYVCKSTYEWLQQAALFVGNHENDEGLCSCLLGGMWFIAAVWRAFVGVFRRSVCLNANQGSTVPSIRITAGHGTQATHSASLLSICWKKHAPQPTCGAGRGCWAGRDCSSHLLGALNKGWGSDLESSQKRGGGQWSVLLPSHLWDHGSQSAP